MNQGYTSPPGLCCLVFQCWAGWPWGSVACGWQDWDNRGSRQNCPVCLPEAARGDTIVEETMEGSNKQKREAWVLS